MRRRAERGQALVEFALVVPIFLLLLISIFDLGHVVWANDTLSNAAREAARFAIVHGGSESTTCPVGPPGTKTNIPAPSSGCPFPSPSKQSIYDTATGWANAAGTNVTVQACYWSVSPCTGDTDETSPPATNDRGMSVTVTVSANIGLTAPALFGLGSIRLSSSSTMLVNH